MSAPEQTVEQRIAAIRERIAKVDGVRSFEGVITFRMQSGEEADDDKVEAAGRLIANAVTDLRFLLEQLDEARRDSQRLSAFAEMLRASAGTKLEGMIEVVFAVDPPDGGSVSIGFGNTMYGSATSAEQALRAAIDAARSASTPTGEASE